MAGANRSHREDGKAYSSPVIAEGECAYCGNKITYRAEGRPPKFCSPSCRSGAHRRSRPTGRTKAGWAKGQRN